MSDLVTGEAVVLELRLAKLPSRALALAIDLLVMLTAGSFVLVVLGAVLPALDNALAVALLIVFGLLVFVGYPVVIETLTRGRSIGKMALGLRVVRDDGGPIRFRHALSRGLAGFVVDFTLLFGSVAVITSLASARGKRVGDILAGTVVVRERMPGPALRPAGIPMPHPLADWASTLELSRLPDGLALLARQFLLRAAELAPQPRAATAARLATDIARHVAPVSPPGTPAEAYLAAVVAERRRRELARLAPAQPLPAAQPARAPVRPVPVTAGPAAPGMTAGLAPPGETLAPADPSPRPAPPAGAFAPPG